MKKFEADKLLKWVPVVVAGLVAVCQAIGEQQESERIDNMEERLARLEGTEEACE